MGSGPTQSAGESDIKITRVRGREAATLLASARPSIPGSAARVLAPDSKLATARALDANSATSTLGEMLGLETVEAEDLYAAMGWPEARQAKIEKALAERHLHNGTLALSSLREPACLTRSRRERAAP